MDRRQTICAMLGMSVAGLRGEEIGSLAGMVTPDPA